MDKTVQNKVFVSSLLKNDKYGCFKEIKEALGSNVELIALKNTSDIWMRDYMPIQIGENTFVAYRYCPDYLWTPERYKYITKRFSTREDILKNADKDLPFCRSDVIIRETNLILDGGNVVVCGDKVILTDKIFIENRPKSQDYIIGELKRTFGKEIVIIPSDPYEITEAREEYEYPEDNQLPLCHADGILAPIDDDSILIADYGPDPLGYVPQLMNALSPYFKLENIKHLDFGNQWVDKIWIYINFLRIGDLVLMPALDDQGLNDKAKSQLTDILKTNNIHQINTTAISFGSDNNTDNYGGALHCVSWEFKAKE